MKHILCVAIMFFVFFTKAIASDAFCVGTSSPRTLVVFGNGIMNTHKDATESLERAEELLRATLPPEEFALLDFELAENKTYGLLNDLYESAKQKALSDNVAVSFWRWWGGIEVMPDFFQTEMLRLAARFDFSSMVGSTDLNEHVSLYRTSLTAGKKVVNIAHSQGNFFANAAWNTLFIEMSPTQMKGFGIVSVANPTSFVGGGGPHTTLKEDKIVNAVRLTIRGFGPLTLDSLVMYPMDQEDTNVGSEMVMHRDFLMHSFVKEYTAEGSNTVGIITQNIVTMIHSRVHPPVFTDETIVSITLTPGAGQDMDLHVYEHNGAHVTSLSPVGIAGKFDLIDSAGYGPERYIASCSELTDSYTVGVSYSQGSAPISATLEIRAGSIVRNYTIPALPSWGTPLYNIIIPVAGIGVVPYSDRRGYEFSVYNTFGTPIAPIPTPRYSAF